MDRNQLKNENETAYMHVHAWQITTFISGNHTNIFNNKTHYTVSRVGTLSVMANLHAV